MGLWADAAFKPYEPSKYALCPAGPAEGGATTPSAVEDFPAPAQELLRGKKRTYNGNPFLVGWSASGDPLSAVDCFELSSDEAGALLEIVPWAGLLPILPHGAFVTWGG